MIYAESTLENLRQFRWLFHYYRQSSSGSQQVRRTGGRRCCTGERTAGRSPLRMGAECHYCCGWQRSPVHLNKERYNPSPYHWFAYAWAWWPGTFTRGKKPGKAQAVFYCPQRNQRQADPDQCTASRGYWLHGQALPSWTDICQIGSAWPGHGTWRKTPGPDKGPFRCNGGDAGQSWFL